MDGLGFFCLGVSAGMLAGASPSRAPGQGDMGRHFVALLPALLSGAAVLSLPSLSAGSSSHLFPIGLALAIAWMQFGRALEISNIKGAKYVQATLQGIAAIALVIIAASQLGR